MAELPFYQEYPPFPANLWSIDTPKNLRYPKPDHPKLEPALKSFFDNIKKAFRLYVELISFYDENSDFYFPQETFTQKDWREVFNSDYIKYSIFTWLDTFKVNLHDWLIKFEARFGLTLNEKQKEEILSLIPFKCLKEKNGKNGIRTFNNDFICLATRSFLLSKNKQYTKLHLETITTKLISVSHLTNTLENSNFSDQTNNIIFDELLKTTSESLREQQRFFIKFQHIVTRNDLDKIEDIVYQLRKVWSQEDIPLISIKYASSSQQETVDLIIFPICLFYNQRGIYLTGYGSKPSNLSYLGYYNYRLDHFLELDKNKYIFSQEWDEDNPDIHLKLLKKKEELQELNSADIYDKLQEGLGVDLDRELKTMLLRFPQDFHKYYIKNTKRHDTFKQLNINNLQEFWQKLNQSLEKTQTKLTENDKQLISKVIENNPDDAYYIMNYRHGKEGGYNVEADVIMRLRSWGHNVEILCPHDLRQRMRADSQKAWEIYK